jgi:CheY-like chemotaxis protein
MLKMLKRMIGEGIELIWRPGSELKPVKIDPSQVDQLLANLLVNARDALSGEGQIMIETSNVTLNEADCAQYAGLFAGEYTLLTVSDTGSGMDQETLSRLFEPFYTTKEVGKGTGLGLATVFGIVKQNNGNIYVASQPGKGTTFKIYLPGYDVKVLPASPVERSETRPGGAETILMVEDEETLLELGQEALVKLGYVILAATKPAEALRIAQEYDGAIHLLITDVVMPGMNGKKLAEQINLLQPGIKCLFMSGYSSEIIGDQGVLGKDVFFIQKPFLWKDLAAKVRQVLEKGV